MGEYFYSPCGEMQTGFSSGTDISKYKYTGQQEDASTGLYYYKARFYDPGVGRFLTADSVLPNFADTQAFNRYMYVEGNPVNHNDPSGHWPGKGFLHRIIEKSVKTAVHSGVNIVKKIPEGLQKVQSGIVSVTGNMVQGLRKVPVILAGFINDTIEGFHTIENSILSAACKAANYISRTANSMLMGAAALYNNTIFNGDWWECQWNGWLKNTLLTIATIAIFVGAFYLGPVVLCFAIAGALIGGTEGDIIQHPFSARTYSKWNFEHALIGSGLGTLFGLGFQEGILVSESPAYPGIMSTILEGVGMSARSAAIISFTVDMYTLTSYYADFMDNRTEPPWWYTIWGKIDIKFQTYSTGEGMYGF